MYTLVVKVVLDLFKLFGMFKTSNNVGQTFYSYSKKLISKFNLLAFGIEILILMTHLKHVVNAPWI